VHTVRLPDGRISTREIVEHSGAVAMVPILDHDRVILIRQFRQAAGEALLEIPAGTLEPQESPEECARRELQEEIGYRCGRLEELFSSFLAPGYSTEMLHTYLALDLTPAKGHADADEFVEPEIIRFQDVPHLIRSGAIKDAKTICGLLLAKERLAAGSETSV